MYFFEKLIMVIAFKWSHSIKVIKGKVPDDVNWIENGVFFVAKPLVNRHIGHFIESVNQVLLKLRYPFVYPHSLICTFHFLKTQNLNGRKLIYRRF